MRPPIHQSAAALQQNEAGSGKQHQQQQPQQQQHSLYTPTTTTTATTAAATVTDLTRVPRCNNNKLQQREFFVVENHLNFACSTVGSAPPPPPPRLSATTRATYQPQQQQQKQQRSSINFEDDSIQLVDLSTSPPTSEAPVAFAARYQPHADVLKCSVAPLQALQPSQRSSYSRSSSSEDGSYSGGDKLPTPCPSRRDSTFDDAAEHFIINFPADSPAHQLNESSLLLPLSETEPLLSSSESTPAATRSQSKRGTLCLSKNSASLIFTRKELPAEQQAAVRNKCNNNSAQRRHHHSERSRKPPKHLPATYQQQQQQQQQRRSLQLNYNNNLVTTSTCGSNNNYCCTAKATSGPLVARRGSAKYCGGSGNLVGNIGGAVLHNHHNSSALPSPTGGSGSVSAANATTAAATRKQLAYSWYAPVYSALEEELEQDSRDSSPIHNLANTKKHPPQHYQHHSSHISTAAAATAADKETVALLESRNQINIQAQLHPPQPQPQPHPQSQSQPQSHSQPQSYAQRDGDGAYQTKRSSGNSKAQAPNSLPLPHAIANSNNNNSSKPAGQAQKRGPGSNCGSSNDFSDVEGGGPHASSLGLAGGPLPRRRRFENFLKSLVGLKSTASSGRSSSSAASNYETSTAPQQQQQHHLSQLPSSPEITITRTPSEQNVAVLRDPAGRHDAQTKLAYAAAQSGSTSSLNVVQQKLRHMMRREGSAASLNHERHSQSIVQYSNGLRKCETVLALTRQPSQPLPLCSPGMGASLPHTGSGIFSASGVEQIRPLNRLRHSMASIGGAMATCSRCSSLLSLAASGSRYSLNAATVFTTVNNCAGHQQSRCHQRHCNNISSSNSRNRIDEQAPLQTTINAAASTSSTNTTSGVSGCDSRKSSAGAQSACSSGSPPSNMTTTTLNSNFTPTSSTPATPTTPTMCSTPTNRQPPADAQAGIFISFPPASSTQFPPASQQPITLSSLLSMPVAEPLTTTTTTTGIALLSTAARLTPTPTAAQPFEAFTCKLCLVDVESAEEATTLQQCGCQFCTECMRAYVEFEISEAAYDISCPDAQCPAQGIMTLPEIGSLTTANLMKKHHRYRLNREIELDKSRTWCPRAGCETVCRVGTNSQLDAAPSTSSFTSSTHTSAALSPSGVVSSVSGDTIAPFLCAVQCPSCKDEFCSGCKKAWHPNMTCEEYSRRLVADGQDDIGIPFDNDLIKCCPMCAVPIEKDEGCAQMMCKRCKHVFCWYCLASLDDDFLLRHYDKGPCKNKLGHSRASVVWHRAQVIGIFAGFGILLLVASPLLLLAAPCIICCKCRICSGSKIDEGDGDLDEATALQS